MASEEHGEPQLHSAAGHAGWPLLGLIFFGLYAFATLTRRGDTWGLHSLAHLPLAMQAIGLVACLGLLYRPLQERVVTALHSLLRPFFRTGIGGNVALIALGFACFLLYYTFPIRTEVYGDTRTILHAWAENTELPTEWFSLIFDASLWKSREVFTILLHRTVAHSFAIPIGDAYRVVSALSGALTISLWFFFVRRDFSHSRWGPLLLLLGGILGSYQIFFGHVENYAFALLTSLAFLLMGSLMLDGKASFWTVLLLFLFAVKAHATALYFLPAFLILVAYSLGQRFPSLRGFLTWRRLAVFLITPFMVAGTGLYFFVFGSYNEPPSSDRAFEQVFLPIISPLLPTEYTLQSLSHLLDLGNVLLLVGTPAIVALLGVILFHRRAIAWQHPRVMFATMAIVFPTIFYAALNPALSMPRDWDLYCLLGGPLLLFFAAVLAHSDRRIPSAPVHGTVMAFAVFSLGFYALNAWPSKLSLHLEDAGEHVFKTYHANASYIIASAQAMERVPASALARRLRTVKRLEPAVVGEDSEYAHLLTIIASNYRAQGDRERALHWMERAAKIVPSDVNVLLWLSDYYLWAGRTERAQRSIAAILQRDPRNLDALIQGAFVAAQQQDLAGALGYFERAGALAPEDREIAAWTEEVRKKQTQLRKGG